MVEVLGYRWHRSGAQMRLDAERLNRLLMDGFLVLQFTYSDIVERPDHVIETVKQALNSCGVERAAGQRKAATMEAISSPASVGLRPT